MYHVHDYIAESFSHILEFVKYCSCSGRKLLCLEDWVSLYIAWSTYLIHIGFYFYCLKYICESVCVCVSTHICDFFLNVGLTVFWNWSEENRKEEKNLKKMMHLILMVSWDLGKICRRKGVAKPSEVSVGVFHCWFNCMLCLNEGYLC